MAYQRPNIVSGVTKATKAFFENIFDGLDEAAERDEAFSEGLNGKLSKADADANYAPIDDPRFEGLGGGGPVSVTYNPDGSVASVTENGITTTYGYNPDGTIASDLRNGVLRTYAYDGAGNLTGIAIEED